MPFVVTLAPDCVIANVGGLVSLIGTTSNGLLSTVNVPSAATRTYPVPGLSILQPVNVVAPFTLTAEQPVSTAPLVPVPLSMLSATVPL